MADVSVVIGWCNRRAVGAWLREMFGLPYGAGFKSGGPYWREHGVRVHPIDTYKPVWLIEPNPEDPVVGLVATRVRRTR